MDSHFKFGCAIGLIVVFMFAALFYGIDRDLERVNEAERICRSTPGAFLVEGQTGGYKGCMKPVK